MKKLAILFAIFYFGLLLKSANSADVLIPSTDLICRLNVSPQTITLGQSAIANWSSPGVSASLKLDGVVVTGTLGSKTITPTAAGTVSVSLACDGIPPYDNIHSLQTTTVTVK